MTNRTQPKEYEVPELGTEGSPLIRPQKYTFTFIFRDWFIILSVTLAVLVGWVTYHRNGNDLDKGLKVTGGIIGITGAWLAYSRLSMANGHQIATVKQKERHHIQMLDFYKKKASLDIITEWYKEFMYHSSIARNFRKVYADGMGGTRLDDLEKAIKRSEEAEHKLLFEAGIDENGNKIVPKIPEDKILLRKNIIPILNYFEKISIAILQDAVDENIIKDYFYDAFIIYHDAFKPLMDIRKDNSHNGTPRAFMNYRLVVKEWKEKPLPLPPSAK